MFDLEFKQKLALALASNPEFVRLAERDYDHKMTWRCVSDSINNAIKNIDLGEDTEKNND